MIIKFWVVNDIDFLLNIPQQKIVSKNMKHFID